MYASVYDTKKELTCILFIYTLTTSSSFSVTAFSNANLLLSFRNLAANINPPISSPGNRKSHVFFFFLSFFTFFSGLKFVNEIYFELGR